MIALIIIVLGLVVATVLILWLLDAYEPRQPSLDEVRNELFVADQQVDSEFRRARRAMNDASGQSWRNLAG